MSYSYRCPPSQSHQAAMLARCRHAGGAGAAPTAGHLRRHASKTCLHSCPAAAVLEVMRAERVQPVTRTYNTVMIACNTSGQWQVVGRRLAWGWTGGVELPATAWHDGRPAAWSGVYLAVCHWVGGWVGWSQRGAELALAVLLAVAPRLCNCCISTHPRLLMLFCRRRCACMTRCSQRGSSPTPPPTTHSYLVSPADAGSDPS